MMLSEYESNESAKRLIDKIILGNNMEIAAFNGGLGISASLYLVSQNGLEFYIHEFPGNCSSLVISNVQGELSSYNDSSRALGIFAVKVAIEIAEDLEYGALFASGTDIKMKEVLEAELGFKPVAMGVHNPHSGNDNFFMMRIIE